MNKKIKTIEMELDLVDLSTLIFALNGIVGSEVHEETVFTLITRIETIIDSNFGEYNE